MIKFPQLINWIDRIDMYMRFVINIHKNILWKNMIKDKARSREFPYSGI